MHALTRYKLYAWYIGYPRTHIIYVDQHNNSCTPFLFDISTIHAIIRSYRGYGIDMYPENGQCLHDRYNIIANIKQLKMQ